MEVVLINSEDDQSNNLVSHSLDISHASSSASPANASSHSIAESHDSDSVSDLDDFVETVFA